MSSIDPNPRPRRRRGALYFLVLLLLVCLGTALWSWLTLQWSYSDGTRSGVLQKFSRKGWLCKTEEGELAQYVGGVAPQIWPFSVRDPQVGAQIEKIVGARVRLHYTEHPGVPSSCFGDTRYFVDQVTVTDPSPALTAPVPAVPPAQPLPSQPPAPASAAQPQS
jgi:hypothetical protein